MAEYNREVLVHTITYHRKIDIKGCMCGWSELGKDHSKHVADVYEEAARKQECVLHGHSWDIVEDMTGPVSLICTNCGQSRDVARP